MYATGEVKLYDSARFELVRDELLLERGRILGEVAEVAGDVPAADDHQADDDAADDELGRGAEVAVLEHVDRPAQRHHERHPELGRGAQSRRARPAPAGRTWRRPWRRTSIRHGSRPTVRQTANRPLSVMYAAMPSTTRTTQDLRLPAPARISVLLPQPEESVMPKPNRKPPTSADSQATLVPV